MPRQGVTSKVGIMGPGRARLPQGIRNVVEPPQTGIKDVLDHLFKAYAYDINIRTTDEDRVPLDELFEGVGIELQKDLKADPDRNPVPEMEPFTIHEDDRVRAQATLVEHLPVFPSFGFRFESEYGVIAFSGDTTETPNMVGLSRDADLLVHEEAINMDYYRDPDFNDAFLHHLESSHTTPEGIFSDADPGSASSTTARTPWRRTANCSASDVLQRGGWASDGPASATLKGDDPLDRGRDGVVPRGEGQPDELVPTR